MSVVPETCEMSDLSDLQELQGQAFLTMFAGFDYGLPRALCLYRRILARLVDKAIVEYRCACTVVLDQVSEKKRDQEEIAKGRFIYMFSFTDHMENCINAVRRACALLERLNALKEFPTMKRVDRRLIEKTGKSLIRIRNTIEHIDEAILKDEVGENEPIMLRIAYDDDKHIQIGKVTLSFFDLEQLIQRLHVVTSSLIQLDGRSAKND